MKRTVIAAFAAVVAAAAFAAPASYLKVDRLNIGRQDSLLNIMVEIDPADIRPGRDREVIFTPVLRADNSADSLELQPVVIAGKNRYLLAERHGFVTPGGNIFRAGHTGTAALNAQVPFADWMTQSTLVMRQENANCCEPIVQMDDTPLAHLDFVPAPFEPELPYIALTGDSVVELSAEGRAYVDFIVNRTEIRPHYRRNRVEIAKIIASIDRVRNDSMAIITAITVKGFASPEGPYANNVRLAVGRTEALKEYVRSHYNFDPEIMRSDYQPEDWAGLRAWVEECTLPHRDEILAIIDSNMEPDPKDHEIRRRYPQEYALMLDSIYPALRHSDYTVKYRIRTTVDVEQLKATMATAPERLRPVDFYRIATSYDEGSPAYEEALMKAVEIWPDDPEVNVNAANIAMRHGDLDAAADYANRAGDRPEAVFTRAVLAARMGDRARAMHLLEIAAGMDYAPAVAEFAELRRIESTPKVEYLIDAAH